MEKENFEFIKRILGRAYRINELIGENMQELAKLRMMRDSIKSSLDEKSGSRQSGNASYVKLAEKIIEYENKIRQKNADYLDIRIELRRMIDNVDNVNYNLILKKRYLQFMTFEKIAVDLNYTDRSIYRLHERALIAFEKANQEYIDKLLKNYGGAI